MRINTYYHGGGNYELFHNGVLWLTVSKEYAEDYALENSTPILFTITIDEAQLKCCSFSDYVDDPYNPSTSEIQAIMNDGYNCYELYYDEDDCYGLALFSKKPIINIRRFKLKRKMRITEQDLHKIVENCVKEALEEGWKNLALTGAIGAASLVPQNGNAQQTKQTYNYRTPNEIRYQNASTKQDSLLADKIYDNDDYITNHPMSEKELASIFPQAYKDRNANPQTWQQNQIYYCGGVYGRNSIVGKIAASKGKNPWQAILNKYSKLNYQNK